MLLSCSEIIAIYDTEKTEMKPQTIKSKQTNTIAVFNHNCRVVASGGIEGLINFHNSNLDYISCIEDLDMQGYPISALSFNNNSNLLAYGSSAGFVKIWDLKTSSTQLNYKLNNNYVTTMAFNPDSTLLTVGTKSGDISSFFMGSFTLVSNMQLQMNSKINVIKFSNISINYLSVAQEDGNIRVIDIPTGEIVSNFSSFHQGPATGVSFSPINKLFLCSVGIDCKINFYDIAAKKHLKSLTTDSPLTALAFNNDGQTIAVGNINGNILIYDLRNCNSARNVIQGHPSRINYLDFAKRSLNQSITSNNSVNLNTANQLNNSTKSVRSVNNDNIQQFSVNTNIVQKSELKTSNDNKASSNRENSFKENLIKENNFIQPNTKNSNKKVEIMTEPFSFEKKKLETVSNNYQVSNPNATSKKNSNNLIDKMIADLEKNKEKERRNLNLDFKRIDNLNSSTNNIVQNNNIEPLDLDNKTKNFIKECIEAEMFKMRQYLHEEINSFHIDLIRQFEIQHNELIKSLKNFSMVNNKMAKELEKLKKENNNLKSKYQI